MVYGRAMAEEENLEGGSAPHDGPASGNTSQGEPGDAHGTAGSEQDPAREVPAASAPDDTNENADARATVVEPGGEDLSPRA